jgi:hypothetical protein
MSLHAFPPTTLAQFVAQAEAYWRDHPRERRGQAYFNFLYDVNPRLGAAVVGTPDADPFYDDAKIPDLLDLLVRRGLFT